MIRTSSRSRRAFPAILTLAMACGLIAWPMKCTGQAARPPLETQPLGTRTDLVRLDVSVLDKRGNFAGGLTRGDFHVLDDGVEQPVVLFTPVEAPARVLVMVETSPAVYLIHSEHLAAGYALLQGLDAADQVSLVTYSDKAREVLGFTTEKAALQDALNSLQYTIGMGDLNFYDSLAAVVDHIAPGEGKTAVVLLTTGIDSSPAWRWEPLVRRLRGTDVVIFAVALGGALRGEEGARTKRKKRPAPSPQDAEPGVDSLGQLTGFPRADRALKLIAQITGGRAYFPQTGQDFAPIYREIAAALRHQYVLGIAAAHDGELHALTVEVFPDRAGNGKRPPKKPPYRVFARQGYIAPAN